MLRRLSEAEETAEKAVEEMSSAEYLEHIESSGKKAPKPNNNSNRPKNNNGGKKKKKKK